MRQSKFKQYFGKGLFYFLVVAACIVFFFAFWRFRGIKEIYDKVSGILMPIILGFVFAYLLNPLMKTIERPINRFLEKRLKNKRTGEQIARGVGIFGALVIGIAVVVVLISMILPELVRNILGLIYEVPSQMDSFLHWFESIQQTNNKSGEMVTRLIKEASNYFETWMRTDLLKQANVWMSALTEGVISFLGTLVDIIIGLIVSVYVLVSKERFAGQCKKMLYAVMKVENANFTIGLVRKSHEIFGGFIIGKLLDSLIIGILCFFGVTLLDMPYTLLISVIVGVTNVIPFFGPYIGGIPCVILILLVDPIKGVYLAIFILVLQQLDGNIIGPKILGDSTGLTAFWVVFAILLGGGLFGFVGMIMGVPTFAVIYYIVQLLVNRKLEEKELPTSTAEYQELASIRTSDYELVYLTEEEKRGARAKDLELPGKKRVRGRRSRLNAGRGRNSAAGKASAQAKKKSEERGEEG